MKVYPIAYKMLHWQSELKQALYEYNFVLF